MSNWDGGWEAMRCLKCGKPSRDFQICEACSRDAQGEEGHHPDCPKGVDRTLNCRCGEIHGSRWA